jgi:YggT family protein
VALLHLLISLYIWVLFAAALMSWFPGNTGFLGEAKRVLWKLSEPVLAPLRRILPRPRMGAVSIDLSVLVAIIVLDIINRAL